jgi:hypothetical protein
MPAFRIFGHPRRTAAPAIEIRGAEGRRAAPLTCLRRSTPSLPSRGMTVEGLFDRPLHLPPYKDAKIHALALLGSNG